LVDVTVDQGRRSRSPFIGEMFELASLPAFDTQLTYLRTGVFFDVDTRDEPGNPRDGGRYAAKWSSFRDQNLGLYNFGQLDAEVQHYIPFFNQRRVIALRAKATVTRTNDDQTIPFYMLPTLGVPKTCAVSQTSASETRIWLSSTRSTGGRLSPPWMSRCLPMPARWHPK